MHSLQRSFGVFRSGAVSALLFMAGCGGGSSGGSDTPPPAPAPTYSVTATVTGLNGGQLLVKLNGGADITVAGNGSVLLATGLNSGASYTVTVAAQPASPPQVCVVSNASGTIAAASVSNVTITCSLAPLTLTSSTPASAASDVDRIAPLTLLFSAPLDESSVGSAVSLTRNGGDPVDFDAVVSGAQLTLSPAMPLAMAGSYQVTLTTTLRGQNGEALSSSLAIGFTTRDGQWIGAAEVDTSDDFATSPVLAMNPAGEGFVAWTQRDTSFYSVWARRHDPRTGWDSPQRLDSDDTASANDVAIAADATGNAAVVWTHSDGTRTNVWSNRFVQGSGWEVARIIDDTDDNASTPRIALSPRGELLVTYIVNAAAGASIRARRFTPGAGWGPAVRVSDQVLGISSSDMVVDASSNVFVSWSQFDGARDEVHVSRFDASAAFAAGWSAPTVLGSLADSSAVQPRAAVDLQGNALVVWEAIGLSSPSLTDIWGSFYTVNGNWAAPALVESEDRGDGRAPMLGFEPAGDAVAIWQQNDGTRDALVSARFSPATGWSPAVAIDTQVGDVDVSSGLALNSLGDGFAIWRQPENGIDRVWTRRYQNAVGFIGSPAPIDAGVATPGSSQNIAVHGSGAALAVWSLTSGGIEQIWSNRFE
jgi:Bacterial Ig-like domain